MANLTIPDAVRLKKLRKLITESIRIQRDTPETVSYIDTRNSIVDAASRQNHVIVGRRGCGKSLLLHSSAKELGDDICCVYLNCEDFKHHTFPNVLIEILESLFKQLDDNRTALFGKKKKIKEILESIRKELENLRKQQDHVDQQVRETQGKQEEKGKSASIGGKAGREGVGNVSAEMGRTRKSLATASAEIEYRRSSSKLEALNKLLPSVKSRLREFFKLSPKVGSVVIQLDDYYHLKIADQPFVIDYVHRLCKDLPMYFKVATLQNASSLFVERDGQPIGAQQRHDYLPIDIDYTFEDFARTEREVQQIFYEYGRLAKIAHEEMDALFKGEGFRRLVVVAGGIPRDCLSLFLQALDSVQDGDGRIGKDTMRLLSREVFESRIRELKEDSQEGEQDSLLSGIYAIREFCLDNKTNAFVVEERVLRDVPEVGRLLSRLLDYRIIHAAASAFTHKTHEGTYRAFVIDAGCYAFMRKLVGKLNEIDVSDRDAKERMRSAPRVTPELLSALQARAPDDPEAALLEERDDAPEKDFA